MNAYVSKEELALLPANRISYPEHYADAKQQARTSLSGWIGAWLARRRTAAELSRLSDRELSDIGLSRAELGSVFKPGFSRRR